ncbi:MAG TPA: metal ABC transporter ATP-binding protein [Anaerolineaceae bacterium]
MKECPCSESSIPAHLHFEDVTVEIQSKPILMNLSFQVNQGSRVAVVGPNGAGKTTLFKAIVGLLPLRSGSICIHGLPLGGHIDCVAYVPQREEVDWKFPVTVEDVVMMGRYGKIGWLKRPSRQDHAAVQSALEEMRIANLAHTPIGNLSGGQQQRVFLARALAQEPHILLMDEPFTGVDPATQESTLQLLDQLQDKNVTIILSTHDLNLAASHFPLVLLLNRRLFAYGSPEEVLDPVNLQSAFGAQVFSLNGKAVVVDQCCAHDEEHLG